MTCEEFERRAKSQNGYDRVIGNWKILDVHQIPETLGWRDEIDFYCSNSEQVVLLRLRSRDVEKFERVIGQDKDHPNYLIAECPIEKIDNEILSTLLKKFEAIQ